MAAQGFTQRPHAEVSLRTLRRTVARTAVLQVDSVNVLARAHLVPVYSRNGPYDVDLLKRATTGPQRQLVEYWAHVQALMPVELWPLMQHRMDDYLVARGKWGARADEAEADRVLTAVRERGPVTARELDAEFSGPRTSEHWGWNWSEARRTLDFLYMSGQVAISGRTSSFEVRYDVPERVLPAQILAAPVPDRAEAQRELVLRAVRAQGVGTLACLADHFRLPAPATRQALGELVEAGDVVPARVRGWDRPAWTVPDVVVPRRVDASTLLSPFDPVVWNRARTEALFDFRYRIEIYTPAERRVHGYYVLPFLHAGRLAARVDLKADRAAGRLLVRGAFAEPDADPDLPEALAAELRRMGRWTGTEEVVVEPHGDLAPTLAAVLARA